MVLRVEKKRFLSLTGKPATMGGRTTNGTLPLIRAHFRNKINEFVKRA
jgi:hypothetical protein